MVKISIIIPIYNVEKYLRECLDSLINQTFKDIEIICINDGSTDSSLSILEDYAQKDNRIILINQENQGQGVARNNGIDISKGEYIAFVDPDDFIELDAFQILYDYTKTNADVIQFDWYAKMENGECHKNTFFSEFMKKSGFNFLPVAEFDLSDFSKLNFYDFGYAVWHRIYSANFIKNNNIRFAPYRQCEDMIFTLKALILANKILYLNKYLYNYRILKNSCSNMASDGNLCIFDIQNMFKQFLEENHLYQKYEQIFLQNRVLVFADHYKRVINKELYQLKCKETLSKEEYKEFLKY